MAKTIIDNFKVNSSVPIDDRIVANTYGDLNSITYKYDGLKVFLLDTRLTYVWNSSTLSWALDKNGTLGQGTTNYISKWDSSGLGLTNSSIISMPLLFNEVNQKVGIGGTPSEAFQINSNYTDSTLGTSSMPFVVHKGTHTIIGENWYWDIGLNQDKFFNQNFPSSTISFKNGGFEFKGRSSGSSTIKSIMSMGSDGVISISGTTSVPNSNNGSMYYDTNRFKVRENGSWRTISRVYGVYSTLVTQASTSAPSESIVESSVGNGSWSYISTGVYHLTISGGFIGTVPTISGFCGVSSTSVFFGSKYDNNTFEIRTLNAPGGSPNNDALSANLIEIRIY